MGDTDRIMKKRYTIPIEDIESDIKRQLTIPLVDPPGPFNGYLDPEKLKMLENKPEILDILTGLAKLEEGVDWLVQQSLFSNRQRRSMEAEILRLRKQITDEKREREEKQRATDDKSKFDIMDLLKKVIPWLLTAGLGLWAYLKH